MEEGGISHCVHCLFSKAPRHLVSVNVWGCGVANSSVMCTTHGGQKCSDGAAKLALLGKL